MEMTVLNSIQINWKGFFFFKSYILHPDHRFPSILSSQSPSNFPLHQIHSSSISLQKRLGVTGTSNNHGISICNKKRHILSYQGWMRQLSKEKGSQKQAKELETTHAPTVRSHTRKPNYTTITYI